jgi:large subunit ribosomal protein L25
MADRTVPMVSAVVVGHFGHRKDAHDAGRVPGTASLQSAAVSGDRFRLEVEERGADGLGSRNAGRMRKQGLVPGVLYGKGHSRAIAVEERRLRAALTGPSGLHAILDVVVGEQKATHHAVLKDYQQHPVRGTLTHVDFHEVRLDRPIQASVVVQLVGESLGVKEGGVLSQVTREVNVEALPMEIPEHVEVDISAMEIGDTLRLSDVRPIEGVRFLDDPEETVLANVAAPRLQAELEALEEEAAAAEAAEAVEGEEPPEEGEAPEAGEPAEPSEE